MPLWGGYLSENEKQKIILNEDLGLFPLTVLHRFLSESQTTSDYREMIRNEKNGADCVQFFLLN